MNLLVSRFSSHLSINATYLSISIRSYVLQINSFTSCFRHDFRLYFFTCQKSQIHCLLFNSMLHAYTHNKEAKKVEIYLVPIALIFIYFCCFGNETSRAKGTYIYFNSDYNRRFTLCTIGIFIFLVNLYLNSVSVSLNIFLLLCWYLTQKCFFLLLMKI